MLDAGRINTVIVAQSALGDARVAKPLVFQLLECVDLLGDVPLIETLFHKHAPSLLALLSLDLLYTQLWYPPSSFLLSLDLLSTHAIIRRVVHALLPTDVYGLGHLAITRQYLAIKLVAPTPLRSVLVLLLLWYLSAIVHLTTVKIVLPRKDVRGLVNSAIMRLLPALIMAALTLLRNVVDALPTPSAGWDDDVIKEHAFKVRVITAVTTIVTALDVCQTRTACGIQTCSESSLIANQKSNAISRSEVWV